MNIDCVGCVFAQFDDSDKQSGCDADRLSAYHDVDEDFVESGKYKYATLSGLCNMKRPHEWRKEVWSYAVVNSVLDFSLVGAARREIQTPFACVVLYGKHNTMGQLKHTLQSLIRTKYEELNITVIDRKSVGLSVTTTITLCREEFKDSNINWSVNQCVDYNSTPEQQTYKVLKKHKYGYYTIIESGISIKQNYFTVFDNIINTDCQPLLFSMPDDDQLLFTVQSLLYKMIKCSSFSKLKDTLYATVPEGVDNNTKS